jgi:acetyl/propionyl-CoA carboxylase alpha subunit
MSLEVRIEGRRRQIDLRREGDCYRGCIGTRRVEAEVLDRGPGSLLIRMGDRAYDVTFDSDGGRLFLDLGNRQVALEILDPLRPDASADKIHAEGGRREIRAAMPGKVVAVKVRPGESVVRGQGLIVLEAMKMENEVPSPGAGKVIRVAVAPGETVEAGSLLVSVE